MNRAHVGILLIYEEKEVRKNMSRAQIVTAIDNFIASGIPIAIEIHIRDHWR